MHSIYIRQIVWASLASLVMHMCDRSRGVAYVRYCPYPAILSHNHIITNNRTRALPMSSIIKQQDNANIYLCRMNLAGCLQLFGSPSLTQPTWDFQVSIILDSDAFHCPMFWGGILYQITFHETFGCCVNYDRYGTFPNFHEKNGLQIPLNLNF